MQQQSTLAGANAHSRPAAELPLPAWIDQAGRRRPCFVVDLSSDGARIHCAGPGAAEAGPPLVGARVMLLLEGRPARAAAVVWRDGERLGLRFTTAPDSPCP